MNEQKLREALRIAVGYIDMDALYTFAGGDHDTIKEALATTEPEPTGMPPAPEPDIHYIYVGLGWKPATAQQYAETHRQKCAMHSTIQLQTYGEQCWKAGYKHGAWGDKPSQEPQRHAYLDGVNVERLQCAMSIAGCAADPSIEGLAADLSGHVNRLTAAVANRAPTHKFTANCDQCAAERDNLRAQVELLTATQTPGALIGGGAPSQEPAVNQQLTTEPLDEREAFEKWLGIKPCGAAHDFGWAAWQARAAMAQVGGINVVKSFTNDTKDALMAGRAYAQEALIRFDDAYDRHPSTEPERNAILTDIQLIDAAMAKGVK